MTRRICALAFLSLSLAACGSSSTDKADKTDKAAASNADATKTDDAKTDDAGPKPASTAAPGVDGTTPSDDAPEALQRVLTWLDPDAVAAATINLPDGVEQAPLVAVFGVPPRGAELLDAASEVDDWLGGFIPEDSPPDTWLGHPALAMTSAFSSAPYVVRPLTKPKDEVAKVLDAGEFDKRTVDGFDVWYPKRSFPYRVVMLDKHTVAFVPAKEPGSGLSPLTAGRDMPASDLETQMVKAHEETPGLHVELFAAGPMMHFDLDPPLVGARFELLPWQGGGLEGRVLLQPERDSAAAVTALEAREPVGESDRIVELAKKVAYQLDGDFVVGLLQLPAEDVKALGEVL